MLRTLVAVFLMIGLPGAAVAQEAGGPPSVIVAEAEIEEIAESAVFSGRVRSPKTVEIMARVEGFLGPQEMEDGESVEEGELLFTINDDRYRALLDGAEAAVASAEASRALAQVSFARAQELVERNVGTQSQLDEARANLQQADAALAARRAELELARLDLSYTEIRSPINGRMSEAAFSEGALVGPESGPLARVVAEDPMRVVFPVTQETLLEARREQDPSDLRIRLRLADGSIYSETGELLFSAVSAEEGTDSVPITAEIPNPDRLLVDGQLVDVVIETTTTEPRLVIPQAALLLDQQGPYVLGLDDANTVEVRRIATGEQQGTMIEVLQGLEAGDRVIVSGLTKVQPGIQVDPQMAAEGGA